MGKYDVYRRRKQLSLLQCVNKQTYEMQIGEIVWFSVNIWPCYCSERSLSSFFCGIEMLTERSVVPFKYNLPHCPCRRFNLMYSTYSTQPLLSQREAFWGLGEEIRDFLFCIISFTFRGVIQIHITLKVRNLPLHFSKLEGLKVHIIKNYQKKSTTATIMALKETSWLNLGKSLIPVNSYASKTPSKFFR